MFRTLVDDRLYIGDYTIILPFSSGNHTAQFFMVIQVDASVFVKEAMVLTWLLLLNSPMIVGYNRENCLFIFHSHDDVPGLVN